DAALLRSLGFEAEIDGGVYSLKALIANLITYAIIIFRTTKNYFARMDFRPTSTNSLSADRCKGCLIQRSRRNHPS
ncbi:MAG TPA: hypothetical protein PKU83_05265, partial [Chryseolinea sp.]|nr:hypothetical protein [Chryseolinea sp.]